MVVIANTSTKAFSLLVNGVDILTPASGKGAVPLDTIRWQHNGHNATSTLEFVHEDPSKAFAIPAGAEVQFLDQSHGGLLFGGYLQSRELVPLGSQQGRAVKCTVSDYSVALDRWALGPAWSSGAITQDFPMLQSVLSYIGFPFPASTAFYTTIGAQTFAGLPARSIVEQILSLAQGVNQVPMGYLITPSKVLQYFRLSDYFFLKPANVSDVTPTPAGSMAVQNLTLEYDESEVINKVYVRGSSKATSGWAWDIASVNTYGWRMAIIDRPSATTLTLADNYARAFFVDSKDATLRGHFDVDGVYCDPVSRHWYSDMPFTITNSALSLVAASFRTTAVETTWLAGNGAHRHRVQFGGLPRSGLARILRGLTAAGVTTAGGAALPTAGQRIVGTIG